MEDLIILARVFLRLVNQPIFSFQSEGIILALFAMHSHEPLLVMHPVVMVNFGPFASLKK